MFLQFIRDKDEFSMILASIRPVSRLKTQLEEIKDGMDDLSNLFKTIQDQ